MPLGCLVPAVPRSPGRAVVWPGVATAEVQGLYVAAGMGGSGFKTGPAVGMCMAELILDGSASTVDITPFCISRFEEGEEIAGEVEYEARPPADLWGG